MLEADKGRFPVRQCDTLRQEVTLLDKVYPIPSILTMWYRK
jgi:hypothetical protein